MVGDLGETANSTQTVAGLAEAQPHLVINVGDYSCECGSGAPAGSSHCMFVTYAVLGQSLNRYRQWRN